MRAALRESAWENTGVKFETFDSIHLLSADRPIGFVGDHDNSHNRTRIFKPTLDREQDCHGTPLPCTQWTTNDITLDRPV